MLASPSYIGPRLLLVDPLPKGLDRFIGRPTPHLNKDRARADGVGQLPQAGQGKRRNRRGAPRS